MKKTFVKALSTSNVVPIGNRTHYWDRAVPNNPDLVFLDEDYQVIGEVEMSEQEGNVYLEEMLLDTQKRVDDVTEREKNVSERELKCDERERSLNQRELELNNKITIDVKVPEDIEIKVSDNPVKKEKIEIPVKRKYTKKNA